MATQALPPSSRTLALLFLMNSTMNMMMNMMVSMMNMMVDNKKYDDGRSNISPGTTFLRPKPSAANVFDEYEYNDEYEY